MKIDNYYHNFLSRYSGSDYFTKARARLLLTFLTVTSVIIVVFTLSLSTAGFDVFFRTARFIFFFLAGIIAAMVLLRKGRYLFGKSFHSLFIADNLIGIYDACLDSA